jgi:hypothetical protein
VKYEGDAECPTGKVVVGGGGAASIWVGNSFSEYLLLGESLPLTDGSAWAAYFTRYNPQQYEVGQTIEYTVWAVCIDGTAPAQPN